ncbi:TonB-linked outer membrane protein, SusC/RagA family [Chitinophaga terrae (ex Kim and Jung 2007)]|uniref:TonB-linked outer membrane protein, SusC/RagA family n=2 Tax=Chitinophaga terrae (ex Kim and Jung 2007) TaxID=408074 RepID=A0A1H4GBL6_9BACT|nr:TonB-linked outer membrane protein, SusC/RagA family [Chitinophaga terrae (ex Kim and Jung 2007)]
MNSNPRSRRRGTRLLLPARDLCSKVLFIAFFMASSFSLYAQSALITLTVKNEKLESVLKKLKQQTGYSFIYENELLDNTSPVTLQAVKQSLKSVLDECFRNQPLQYSVVDKSVIISKRGSNKTTPESITVRGRVLDSKGEPMPGVTIRSRNNNANVQSKDDGTFSLTLKEANDVVIFTFVGYITQEVAVSGSTTLNITLKEKTSDLADVVVVAYGQQKKVTTIGAQSSVRAEDLKLPAANLTNAIAGRVAGIIGVQRSGQPGYDNAEIYIRGISTFTNSSPLVLVDGIERDFANVDPEDIASFSVLKDASATAVYGVRGANGVILIQTKTGKVGKPLINAQYDQGYTQFTKIPKFADGVTYLRMANEAYKNSNPNDPLPKYSEERINQTATGEDPDLSPNVDWFDVLFNKAGQNRRARVNANGGSENAQYYLSIGYYDEKGMYKTDGLANYNSQIKFTRYNFTSNLVMKLTKSTKVDFGAAGWISNGNFPGSSVDQIWGAAYLLPPILIPPIYSNGLHSQLRTGDIFNPYNLLTQSGYVTEFRSQLWSNIRVTQDLGSLVKGLSVTGMFSFDNYNSHNISRTKTVDGYMATGRDSAGNLIMDQTSIGSNYLGYSRSNGGSRQFYTEAALNYKQNFGKNEVTGMVLYNQSDRQDAFAGDFISSIPYRYLGVAGRVTYAYDNTYLAEANFGYNGSETFEPKKRFGFFPSFGVGWVPSEATFFQPLINAIQFLKVRFSYGLVGNGNIGGRRFAYISTVGNGNGGYSYGSNGIDNNIDGYDIGDYAVSVTWEKAKKANLGIELKTLHDQVSLVVDIFRENRTGIFRQRGDVPQISGIRSLPFANLGEIHNRGIDATLEINKKVGELQIGFRGNFTWNRAMIINDANAPWPYPWQQRIGRKLGQRFGYTALGLFTSKEDVAASPYQTGTNMPGDIKYKDMNGDGKIDTYDQGPIGYGSIPEIVYGFGPTFNWRGWSLAGWFKGISNVDISLNGDGLQPFSQGGERGNLLAQITDRWTPGSTNPHPLYPRLTYGNDNMNYANSSWWVKNGAFLRLQTLQFGYTFSNKPWLKKAGLSNVYLYFIGNNLITFSGFDLWDVELGDGRGSQYPLVKTFNLGAKLSFR